MNVPTVRTLVLVLAVASAAGCHYGPQVETFEPATKPEGIYLQLDLKSAAGAAVDRISGELLAVHADGLLLNVPTEPAAGFRSPKEVTFVAYPHITDVDARPLGIRSPAATAADRETLRRVSRFPQGLSQELLNALMAAQGQAALAVVGLPE